MPDSQRRASSAVTGSGANAGSTGSEARAACSSPVTRPSSVMSRIRGSSGLAPRVSRASEGREASESTARPSARRTWRQPSPSLSTKPCSTETVAVSPSAAAWSIHPTSRGTCGKPRAVRNWVISTSGLTPGRGRLRDFRISSRPSAIEVLLCSPESRCTSIARRVPATRSGPGHHRPTAKAPRPAGDLAARADRLEHPPSRTPDRRGPRRPPVTRPGRSRRRRRPTPTPPAADSTARHPRRAAPAAAVRADRGRPSPRSEPRRAPAPWPQTTAGASGTPRGPRRHRPRGPRRPPAGVTRRAPATTRSRGHRAAGRRAAAGGGTSSSRTGPG